MKKKKFFKRSKSPMTNPPSESNSAQSLEQYKAIFLINTEIKASSGKTVNICKEHHERIIKILHVIAKNDVSLFSYIYNVLEHHFDSFQEDITELYDNNIEKVF